MGGGSDYNTSDEEFVLVDEQQQQQQPSAFSTEELACALAAVSADEAIKQQQASIDLSAVMEFQAYGVGAAADGVVSLKACAYEPTQRATMDMIVVLDVSGSMEGERIDLAKKALAFLMKNMRATDRFGLVTYSEEARTVIPLTAMAAGAKESASETVKRITTEGRTNLSGGLFKAIEMMRARKEASTVSSILLMTDGEANVGITDESELCAAVNKTLERSTVAAAEQLEEPEQQQQVAAALAASSNTGAFTIYTFGFGASHNANLLKAISDCGEGMYYFIESADIIPKSFADCLGGLISTVGQNLTLRLTARDGATFAAVRSKRTATISADRTSAEIALGDLQSEEVRDILFQLQLPAGAAAEKVEEKVEEKAEEKAEEATPASASAPAAVPATVCGVDAAITYFDVTTKTFGQASCTITVAVSASADGAGAPVMKVVQQRARADTTKAMEESMAAAEAGNFDLARRTLRKAIEGIEGIADEYCKELLNDLQRCLSGLVDRSSYLTRGTYSFNSSLQQHQSQRCNVTTVSYFSTPTRQTMRNESEQFS